MIPATNDGSNAPPRLLPLLNLGSISNLPAWSAAPQGSPAERFAAIRAAGFAGLQGKGGPEALAAGLIACEGGRINKPGEVAAQAARWKREGQACVTIHVGWGHEDDAEVDVLVKEVLAASADEDLPILIETHRATITQDTWRTVQIAERHPDVRFNADFSHWYTGLEMPYGNWDEKMAFLQPVFERVRFFHGRIGNSACIQMPLTHPSMPRAIDHFRDLWTRSFAGFLRTAKPGDWIGFAPELLQGANYAPTWRCPNGGFDEASDRWSDALELVRIARECFVLAGNALSRG